MHRVLQVIYCNFCPYNSMSWISTGRRIYFDWFYIWAICSVLSSLISEQYICLDSHYHRIIIIKEQLSSAHRYEGKSVCINCDSAVKCGIKIRNHHGELQRAVIIWGGLSAIVKSWRISEHCCHGNFTLVLHAIVGLYINNLYEFYYLNMHDIQKEYLHRVQYVRK